MLHEVQKVGDPAHVRHGESHLIQLPYVVPALRVNPALQPVQIVSLLHEVQFSEHIVHVP